MAIIDRIIFRNRVLAAGIAGLAAGVALPAINGDAEESATAITCTNPVSGATSWQIVDRLPKARRSIPITAEITPGRDFLWFDPKDGGNNTLDRKSGDLRASVASKHRGLFSTRSLRQCPINRGDRRDAPARGSGRRGNWTNRRTAAPRRRS